MEETYCSDCKRFTAVVSDHSSGDTICSQCGLVFEPHSIDETSEWRTFGNETVDKSNPHRVGDKSNPLLTVGLTTLISKPKGGDKRFHNVKTQDPDRSLIEAFKMIDVMSERLGLVSTIKDLANEIYKKMEDVKSRSKGKRKDRSKGKKREAMVAACLYAACKKEGKSRTIKEIWGVANGVTKKEIGRAIRHLEDIKDGLCVNAGDFMRRFGSLLGMNNKAVKAAEEAVEKTAEFDIRRSPMTVVAAVIFMITQVSVERKLIPDVAAATGVAQGTIQKCYREIYPYASRLIPAWFANEKDLMMLCSP